MSYYERACRAQQLEAVSSDRVGAFNIYFVSGLLPVAASGTIVLSIMETTILNSKDTIR